ncbi:unnamed protein product [Closterium sp. NIES-54]
MAITIYFIATSLPDRLASVPNVTTSSRSRGRSGRRGGQGAGGGGGGGGGGVTSGGGESAGVGGVPHAAPSDSPAAAGGGDARGSTAAAAVASSARAAAASTAAAAAAASSEAGVRTASAVVRCRPSSLHLYCPDRFDGPAPNWLPFLHSHGAALWGMSASQLLDLLGTPYSMYAVLDSSVSDSVYSSVFSLRASVAEVPVASVGTCVDTSPRAAPEDASLSFTLDSGASHCFFRDHMMLTPLSAPVSVALADPTLGPVTACYTTTLPYHDTYAPLATFHAEPGSSLYRLHTSPQERQQQQQRQQQQLPPTPVTAPRQVPASHEVATSHQVAASGRVPVSVLVAASCLCRSLAHPTVPYHHRLGHPSIPCLRTMASQCLGLGLPRVLPSVLPSLAPPCAPCIEGRLCATPHSSSLCPATEPFETLYLDVWGPALRPGLERESFFLVVVDDYSRYTTVFPLAKKSEVTSTLVRWLLTTADTRGRRLSCLHSDRGATADLEGAGIRSADPGGTTPGGVGVGAESVPPRGSGAGGAGVGAEPKSAGGSSLQGAGVCRAVTGGATSGGATTGGAGAPTMGFVESGTGCVAAGGAGSGGGATDPSESAAGVGARGERVGAAAAAATEAAEAAAAGAAAAIAGAAATEGAAVAAASSASCLCPTLPPPDSALAGFPCSQPPLSPPLSHAWTSRSPRARPLSPVPITDLHTILFRPSPPRSSPSVLPSPLESALTTSLSTPVTDYYRVFRPFLSRVLASLVTNPRASLLSVSALTAAVIEFASTRHLDYAKSLVAAPPTSPLAVGGESALGCDVLEDRQFELEFLVAASPHLCSMLLAPEGDPNALDIPTPRTYAKAVSGPWASQWRAAMDSKMASYRSIGTYVDEREGVDFFQTFAPTPKMITLRVLLHIAAQRDYELQPLDFSTTFLQVWLHKEVWLRRPSAFTGTFPPETKWRLRRLVYCLRQAPREWHNTLRSTLSDLGFQPSSADPLLFVRRGFIPFFVLVYIDDLVFATADKVALADVKSELQKRPTCTDIGPSAVRASALHRRYFLVHWTASVRVAKYLATTSGMGLVLGGGQSVVLTGHCDSSYADDAETHRSTQGYCFSLGSGADLWRSTRSSLVLTSTAEAEFYARAMAAQELRWLTFLLTDLGERPSSALTLLTDIKASILLYRELRLESKVKHINVIYFLLRELQRRGQARFDFVESEANTAHIFTKALPPYDYQRCCVQLGLVDTGSRLA